MKFVVFTSAIFSLAAVLYSSQVNANNLPYYVSNAVTKQNINMVKGDKQSLMLSESPHTSMSSRCSHNINTNYQLTIGYFLFYISCFLICLLLLFQLWLDYNLPRPKKHYK
jgi:hypothetical protein